jgi:hypothetical protein
VAVAQRRLGLVGAGRRGSHRCLLGLLMAAVGGEVVPEIAIEALNDIQVAEKRGWNSAPALEALQPNLDKALTVFAPLQDEPLASVETQMLDLGSYPLHSIVDMFTFDLTTHLRYDILAPRGPVDRDLPPLGEAQLAPAVSWLLGGIPRCRQIFRVISRRRLRSI